MKINQITTLALLISVFSCSDVHNEVPQKIDQTLYIYLEDAQGKDYFNLSGSSKYASIVFSDIGGEYSTQKLNSAPLLKDSLDRYYLHYIAGATRKLVVDNGAEQEYRSDISISMFEKDSTTASDIDTLTLFYKNTPTLFQIKQVDYNGKMVFSKQGNIKNIVKIVK